MPPFSHIGQIGAGPTEAALPSEAGVLGRHLWLFGLLGLAGACLNACAGPSAPASGPVATPQAAEESYVLDLEVGQRYPSGSRVRTSLFGLSFVLPAEWEGRVSPGSNVMVLQSETAQGIGVVVFGLDLTREDLVRRLAASQPFAHGLEFKPAGPVHESDGILVAAYTSNDLVGRATAVPGPDGQGLIFFVAGSIDRAPAFEHVAHSLAASTRFFPIDTSAAVTRWRDYVAGMRLTVVAPVTGAHAGRVAVRSVWDLCQGGTYRARHKPVSTVEAPEESEFLDRETVEAGRWRVEVGGLEAWVVFEESGGRVTRYALEYDGEGLLVDGTRASREVSPDCR